MRGGAGENKMGILYRAKIRDGLPVNGSRWARLWNLIIVSYIYNNLLSYILGHIVLS